MVLSPKNVSYLGLDGTKQVPVDCPPGLEYLTQVDQILVHKAVELLEGKIIFHLDWWCHEVLNIVQFVFKSKRAS